MERVCQVCPCINGRISKLFSWMRHPHFPQGIYDLFAGISFLQLFFKDSVDHKGNKACKEMGLDMLLGLQIYGTFLKVCLHAPEAFFDLPALLIELYDLIDTHVVQIGTYGIEAIVAFFFLDGIYIQINQFFRTDFTILCRFFPYNKPVGVILIFRPLLVVLAVDQLLGPCDLSFSYLPLIVFILDRKRDDQMLFQRLCPVFYFPLGKILFDPTIFVKDFVIVCLLINLIQAESSRRAWQMPSFRVQRKLLEVFRKLIYRLGRDKAADLHAIYGPVVKLSICL